MISTALMSKSKSTRTVRLIYDRMLSQLGQETAVLTDVPIERVSEIDQRVGQMVDECRRGRARIIAGGGGRYGRLIPPWQEEGT
jgi:PHP family Zn ribbon phosphoesterase